MSQVPPSPAGDAAEHRERYTRDPLGYLDECHAKYGDIFALKVMERNTVFVGSPELIKAVYTADTDASRAGEAKQGLFGKILGNSSTLLLDHREHIERRQLIQPRFRGESAKAFVPLMRAAADAAVAKMPRGEVFELHPFFYAMAFDIIFDALFRDTPEDMRRAMEPLLREFAHVGAGSPLQMRPSLQVDEGPESPWGKVMHVTRTARACVQKEIEQRRARGAVSDDILGILIAARDDNGKGLEDSAIVDEVLTTVVAGHETSSIALTWMCHAVYTRPDVLAKLREEITANPGADIDNLPYLDGVVREALRYYALIPAGSARLVKRDLTIGDYLVPEGSMILVAFQILHRRPDLFPHPNEFRPERYTEKKYSTYEWAPFGGGPRRCLGMPFANLELKAVLATVVGKITLRLEDPSFRTQWRGMFVMPADGLRVQIV